MIQSILVMVGGAMGALLRFQAGRMCTALLGFGWPWGTLFVNVAGGLAMGVLAGWLALRGTGGEPARLFLGIGLLGGFTTFSSFGLETVLMLEQGEMASALLYVLLSVAGAVGALWLGLAAVRELAA